MENHQHHQMQQHRRELTFLSSDNFLRGQNPDQMTGEHSNPSIKEVDFLSSSPSPPNYHTDNNYNNQEDDQHSPRKIAKESTDGLVNVSFQIKTQNIVLNLLPMINVLTPSTYII